MQIERADTGPTDEIGPLAPRIVAKNGHDPQVEIGGEHSGDLGPQRICKAPPNLTDRLPSIDHLNPF